MIGMISGIVRR